MRAGDGDADPHRDTDGHCNGNSDGDGHGNRDPDGYCDCHADQHAIRDRNGSDADGNAFASGASAVEVRGRSCDLLQ